MCKTKFLKSPSCAHSWAEIVHPCGDKRGFNTCPTFTDGRLFHPRGFQARFAPAKSCPVCDKKNKYDGNAVRVIKRIEDGYRVGTGPGKRQTGLDVRGGSRPGFVERKKEGGGMRYYCLVM